MARSAITGIPFFVNKCGQQCQQLFSLSRLEWQTVDTRSRRRMPLALSICFQLILKSVELLQCQLMPYKMHRCQALSVLIKMQKILSLEIKAHQAILLHAIWLGYHNEWHLQQFKFALSFSYYHTVMRG